MSFTSDYQYVEQYKRALKRRYNVHAEDEVSKGSIKEFETLRKQIDRYASSIRNELKGSLKFTFSYEKTVAARITIMKYVNKKIRGHLKFSLDTWRKAAVEKDITKQSPEKTVSMSNEKKEIVQTIKTISPETKVAINDPFNRSLLHSIYQKISFLNQSPGPS